MSKDITFPDGLMVKAPREGAPDFVKGSISIKRQELINWLGQEGGEWINLDIKVSKGGKWYASVNTWDADKNKQGGYANQDNPTSTTSSQNVSFPSDIPTAEDPSNLPF
jgi:hypothetical protein